MIGRVGHGTLNLHRDGLSSDRIGEPLEWDGEYVGEWKNDAKYGYGIFTFDSGDVYKGNWKDDAFNGFGRMTYSDGSFFEGEWIDNLPIK